MGIRSNNSFALIWHIWQATPPRKDEPLIIVQEKHRMWTRSPSAKPRSAAKPPADHKLVLIVFTCADRRNRTRTCQNHSSRFTSPQHPPSIHPSAHSLFDAKQLVSSSKSYEQEPPFEDQNRKAALTASPKPELLRANRSGQIRQQLVCVSVLT